MAKTIKMTIVADGKEISLDRVKQLEQARTLHVIDELDTLGADLLLDGNPYLQRRGSCRIF